MAGSDAMDGSENYKEERDKEAENEKGNCVHLLQNQNLILAVKLIQWLKN